MLTNKPADANMKQLYVKDSKGEFKLIESAEDAAAHALSYQKPKSAEYITDAKALKTLVSLRVGTELREVFGVIFLNARHRVISIEHLFLGTVDSCSVYPREVFRRALQHNAAAIVLYHNHPSGMPEPSIADISLTERLRAIGTELGVRILDHIVTGGGEAVSMAERGLA